MRYFLLSVVLVAALAVSACDQQNNVNDPVAGDESALLRAVTNLDLSNEQLAQIDEMYYMQEDLSLLLTGTQLNSFNTLINGTNMSFAGPGDRGYRGFDLGAMMHLRLIIQANPDLDDQTREALLQLIKDANAERLQIMIDYKDDPETMRAKLKEAHDKLIAAMNALLTEEQIANVEKLKEELKQLREERREIWNAQRIEFLVQYYTKVLDLTAEQAEQIRIILQNQYTKIAEIRAANEGDPEALRLALEALMTETNGAIKAVLTAEQLEKWEAMRKLPIKWRMGHRDRP
jgi:Spy/CpxP family protein refolding chaperone